MQSMQRKFGRMTTKRSADDSQVAVLMKDFEDADSLLTKIIESTRAWRDAWISIATFQSRMTDEFDGLYAPIIGSSETTSPRKPVETNPAILARTNRLRREYDELRGELSQELNAVEERMTQPAEHAKESLIPMKKTIKKRNDKKTDFERYKSRVDSLLHKQKRSERDNANLTKAEADLANAKEVYYAADEDLRRRLPTLISLLFSLAPIILRAQVEIQNRMLAHYYTVLHTYCEEEGFPSPPPPMDQVVQDWEIACRPAQDETENMGCLTHGKAIRQSGQSAPSEGQDDTRPSLGSRASSSGSRFSMPSFRGKPAAPPPMLGSKPCRDDLRSVSPTSSNMTPRGSVSVASSSGTSPLPSQGDYFEPAYTSYSAQPPTPSAYPQPAPTPAAVQFSPAGPKIDHFQKTANTPSSLNGSDNIAAAIATKKKRPPPPPRPMHMVTALYDFDGHQPGDLMFREGDRIKVVQKTGSTDDWWEGELGGVRGQFPANYVE